jgi:putative ABC transport system permease protein
MGTLEAMRIALASLWANKLRSALGVVLGVAAVIAVVTFVNGINAYVAERIFNLGADVFTISRTPGVITNFEQWSEAQKRREITLDDYRAVVEQCESCRMVGAAAGRLGRVRHEAQSGSDVNIRGWSPAMFPIYDLELIAGRALTETDFNTAADLVVIGYDIFEKVFEERDPLGKELRVDGRLYTVVGVGKKEGTTLGQSRDNWVVMPITTWMRQYGSRRQNIRIWAKAYDVGDGLQAAIDETRVVLRSRRHDQPGRPDSFEAETNQNFLSIWANISSSFFLVTIALASISLVVGGIVIMNIMLVSVTERTREIGIRKAMGARKVDVLRQFLIESSTMALVGGLIGVVLGITVAKTVTILVGMPSAIALWAVMAGLMVATSVGIFFGVYPARRAADLDPIAALRFEN